LIISTIEVCLPLFNRTAVVINYHPTFLQTVIRQITVFLLLNLPGLTFADSQFRFKHLTTNEGLSQNSVYAIHQDKEGFLWFGTQDGLNRFDGIGFKIFKHRNDDTTSVSDSYILSIAEDENGNLWIGTRNGVNRFNKSTGKNRRYFFPEIFDNDFHQTVQEVFLDNEGDVVMILQDGMYSFSHKDNFELKKHIIKLSKDNPGLKVVQDAQNNYWVSRYRGISCITPNGKERYYPYPNDFQSGGFMVLRKNELWISEEERLLKFSLITTTFQQFSLRNEKNNSVRVLSVDSRQRIWVTTNERVILLTEESGGQFRQTDIKYKEEDDFGLSDKTVQSIYEDNAGLIWFGTIHGGVNIYDPLQSHFKTINETMLKSLLPVWTICEDSRKRLWFGTSGGLVRAIRRDTLKPITSYDALEEAFISFETLPIEELSTQISAIVEDNEHHLWLGVRGNGVVRYDARENKIHHYVHSENDTQGLANNSILSLRKTSNGDIWICTFNGVSIVRASDKTFHNLSPRDYDTTLSNYVIDVYEASDGMMWLSTGMGLLRYDKKNNSLESLQHRENDNRSLSYHIVTTCIKDEKNLWVATLGGGLNQFDKNSESFSHFTVAEGLQNDVLYGMVKDERGNLWFSTNEGISKFGTESKKVTNFGIEEGLRFKEFALNSFFKTSDGEMFFGGVGGVVVFHPDSVQENTFPPPIVLSDIKINYQSIDSSRSSLVHGSISIPKEIHLTYMEKSLTLEFVALNYRNSKMNSYQYKLEGFDEHWIIPERNLRVAHYTNLPSGEFTFIVRAANNSGVWNEQGLRIKIIVFPPFWLTWWFISLMSVAGLASIVVVVRSYSHRKLRRKLQELELQQKIQTERERISRDLHDNVGSQLVNIIAGLEIAEKYSSGSEQKSKALLESLKDDARTSMTQLRQTIWALKTQTMTLQQFADELEKYAWKQFSYQEAIRLEMIKQFDETITLSPIQVLHLFRITQEALTNCLKHSKASRVTLSLSTTSGTLSLSVRDDGRGFPELQTTPMNGNGRMNMERRVQELGGTFTCVNKNGVTVNIEIPLLHS